jgi:hypothetical protein
VTLPAWILIVDAEVDPEVDEEWNRWYDDVHLPEISASPGFRDAARYVTVADGERHYVTIYALDGPDATATAEFARRRGWGSFSDSVRATVRLFECITQRGDP